MLAGDLRLTSAQRDMLAEWREEWRRTDRDRRHVGAGGSLRRAESAACGRRVDQGNSRRSSGHRGAPQFAARIRRLVSSRPVRARRWPNWKSGPQAARGSAIVENTYGAGPRAAAGSDLLFSIVHIQQGRPVLQDTPAAPDGSALTNDGVLKAEDGMVLDWVRDRAAACSPITCLCSWSRSATNCGRSLCAAFCIVAQQQGVVVPLLWYWPRGLKAVGHLSHDTDGNDPQLGVRDAGCHESLQREEHVVHAVSGRVSHANSIGSCGSRTSRLHCITTR